jgi:hypothetical protein
MLGVVSEQFPKGGALALNFTGAVGQVGVGVIGAVFLGAVQDKQLDQNLAVFDQKNKTELHTTYVTEHKKGIFGAYRALDGDKLSKAPKETLQTIGGVQDEAKKDALRTVSLLPGLMLLFYLGLLIYFRYKGGYKPVVLVGGEPDSNRVNDSGKTIVGVV